MRPGLGHRTGLLLLLACLIALVPGCDREVRHPAESEIRSVVGRYNELLSWGYANLDMNRLTEVATDEQAQAEYYHMAALGEGGVKLMATLETLEFDSVSIEETSAIAVTRETWSYTQVSVSTGEPSARSRATYGLRYDLRLSGGRWLVADVTAFDSVELPVEGSTLPTNAVPFQRPADVPPGSE